MKPTITVTNPAPAAALPPLPGPAYVDLSHLPITPAGLAEPQPPTWAELNEGLRFQGIIVEDWQIDFLGRWLTAVPARFFAGYRFDRRKEPSSTGLFSWAANQPLSPYEDETSPALQLSMWEQAQERPADPRQHALAAKQRRGHGPPPADGWRGRERTTKYTPRK